jgi:hypothetical protein
VPLKKKKAYEEVASVLKKNTFDLTDATAFARGRLRFVSLHFTERL